MTTVPNSQDWQHWQDSVHPSPFIGQFISWPRGPSSSGVLAHRRSLALEES